MKCYVFGSFRSVAMLVSKTKRTAAAVGADEGGGRGECRQYRE